jgi:DNA-binding SARP family transcriptional activator
VEIRLLGPLEVRDGERVVSLPRRQQRALLAALALRVGQVVASERLVDDLWGERAPAAATGSLQNTVAALRKALGRDLLVTQAPGYRLALEPEALDTNRFERLLAEARDAEPARKVALLEEALALWHGPALADLDEEHFARREADRLEELRLTATEDRIDAELALGRHAGVVGELETLVTASPPRGRPCGQLMLALYRCGRQAEALEVYRSFRLALQDELGLDPSRELQELERKILRQDPELDPPAEAEHEIAAPAAERRLVSVLAVVPPAEEDPEQLRRRLDELLARTRDVLDRNDGVLERFGPEGLVAVFGAEAPRDDDALRAVRAAAELGLPSGIATGESVGGAGAVFSRAAELARQGGLQVDDRTRALVQHERRLDAPLVGRVEELARLRAAFDAARTEKRCRVVTVLGEPGIGKTRLGRELTATLAGEATTLVGRCYSYGKGQTFLPLLDALQEVDVAAALAGDPEGALATTRLAALAGAQDAGTVGESNWALRRLLEGLARVRPVLLLLDDVHWAEPALLDLVDYLAERVTDAPLLIVSLARPELARPAGEQLPLGPLTPEEARQLVAGLADLDEETRERVIELADGNALYAEQLAAYAAEGGAGLPPTLEAVLAGRIGRLAHPERHVLQRAAVAGREFTRGVVAALSEEPVDAQLSSLSRRSFVHPAPTAEPGDDGYRFHHVLLRDAAYATLTKADRAGLHEQVAAWLDRAGPGDDALAGYHLEQAALFRRDLGEDADELAARAGERLAEAGMRVLRTNDIAASLGLLGRAAALLPAGERRAELEWERSIALRLHDDPTAADQALARAERDAIESGSAHVRARVDAERAHIELFAGELSLDAAIATYAECLPRLRAARDLRGLGRAELELSDVHRLACRFEEVASAAERAEQHYLEAGYSSASCVGVMAQAYYYGPCPVADALRSCDTLLTRSPDLASRASIVAVAGGLHGLAGNSEEGRELLALARSLYEEVGNQVALLTIWSPLVIELELSAGDEDAAEAEARSNLEALETTAGPSFVSTRAAQLGSMLLDRGETAAAEPFVRRAEAGALASDVRAQFWWRGARARILARSGELTPAEEMARDAVAIASLTDASRRRAQSHLALAEVLHLAGRAADAQAELRAARTLLERKGATALLEQTKGAPFGTPLVSTGT